MAETRPDAGLPDDLLTEILSRVPYRSLCRFRCVSRSWLSLCSDPGIRKRSPQTLSGFFCYARGDHGDRLRFLNLSGRGRPLVDPDLPFLRAVYPYGFRLVHCCSGLLLCKCYKTNYSPWDGDYVVCNPATEKWTALPDTEALHPSKEFTIRLGFDPAVPSRFEVFVLEQDCHANEQITGVAIYSSETGRWTSLQSEWGQRTSLDDYASAYVFFNGTLHLTTCDSSLVTVDTEGKIWREIGMPHKMAHQSDLGFIGQSQGYLYAMHIDHYNGCLLSVWILEEYGSGQWTLKHTTNVLELLGRQHCNRAELCLYTLIAIHPQCNLIFFIDGVENTVVSYDMDSREVHVICSIKEYFHAPFPPYIPCFAEWSSDGR